VSDDKPVKRGELVLLIGEEEDPEEELKRMNRGKMGRPFTQRGQPHLDPSDAQGVPPPALQAAHRLRQKARPHPGLQADHRPSTAGG